jgi:serine/threonine-protein kinase HipA
MQTLCAMAHLDFKKIGAHSYDQLLQTVESLNLGSEAMQQTFRRMVFNVAAANNDDHTKNFAFLATHDGEWSLAPAYDVTHAYNPTNKWISRHLMSVNGKFDGIDLEDLHEVGDRHNITAYKKVAAEVLEVVEEWKTFAASAEVSPEVADEVARDITNCRPLRRR